MQQLTIFNQPEMDYQTFKGLAEKFKNCKSVQLLSEKVVVTYRNGVSFFPITRTDKMQEVLINLKYAK